MNKRKRVGGVNTLLNYFSSPATKKTKLSDDETNTSLPNGNSESPKTKPQKEQPEDPPAKKSKSTPKFRKIRVISSDTENEADNSIQGSDQDVEVKEKTSTSKKLEDSFKFDLNKSLKDSPKRDSSATVKRSSQNVSKAPESQEDTSTLGSSEGNWIHCQLEFLKPEKIRDSQGRYKNDPEYDPTTLYVPQSFLSDQTPAHRQWWEMKSKHYDCVLFFKVGKFYELYHMDASVGVAELGFTYMKGEFAHSGFPEPSYPRMAATLVSKGYKVARVEQTETPEMMQERCKKTGARSKHDKVVRREICQVTVRGAQVCGLLDPGPADCAAAYMLAIVEEESQGCSTYGLCFLETSIGQFHLGQFKDDKHSSRLLTALAHYPPALIVSDRKSTSARTSRLLSHCAGARREAHPFAPPEKTLKTLAEKYYRTNADGEWPEGIRPFLHDGDALGLTPAPNASLAVKALGGCVAYLTDCLLDIQILGMAQFAHYAPPDVVNRTLSQDSPPEGQWEGGSTMILDAITLKNLRVVQDEGCLYDKLNFCTTSMGKRLLHQWVCAPSCSITVIKERQMAIRELFENQELCQDAKTILSKLPDLERHLAKIHALGNSVRSKNHPDSRAIFYEAHSYSKKKIQDFIMVLKGYEEAMKLVNMFSDAESVLLRRITQLPPDGIYPNYEDTLKFFKHGFDWSVAESKGIILPEEGVDESYNAALAAINAIEAELKEYLAKLEKKFKCRLVYVGTDKKRYQIEVPVSAASKAGPEYEMQSARKGFKRFSTEQTKDFLARMIAAEAQKQTALKELSMRIFGKFSATHAQWAGAARCLASLDVLLSLAKFATHQTGDICLPELQATDKPFIRIVEGRHPCIPIADSFIPNGTCLGGEGPTLLLLTGPNMGGKSTLMRQIGLLTILAHLGSYVPAEECSLSLVDRVFTRVGASDDILSGQSTFLVEMNETAAIMKHATHHSLVLVDELGRGTSTYDGTAIASAVCAALADLGSRAVFSTHYHSLVAHLAKHTAVLLGHMACMVETEDSENADEGHIPEETITFLYKLSPDACPKSYGFNAARLAGIPKEITRRAHGISKKLELEAMAVRTFKQFMKIDDDVQAMRDALRGLEI